MHFQSARGSFGKALPSRASAQLVQRCPLDASALGAVELAVTDRESLCLLICCCDSNPSTPGLLSDNPKTTSYRQLCVTDTLDEVDEALGYQSRFKAEVAYNMTESPPTPYMHRNLAGEETTQRSTNWMGRALKAVQPYQRGAGLTRIPDVTVVKDPTLPPTQDNIAQVYEIKFKDSLQQGQIESYRQIAGLGRGGAVLLNPDNCGCGEKKKQQEVERKLKVSAEGKEIEAIMRRNRLSKFFGGSGPLLPLPQPGPIPVPF